MLRPIASNRHLHRIRYRLVIVGVEDPQHIGHGASDGFLARPSRQPLGNEIEKSDIPGTVGTNNGVADAVERDFGALFFCEQRLFHALAFDGIAQRKQQPARLNSAFDEKILSAFLQRLCGHGVVVKAGQHDQGQTRRRSAGSPDRHDTLAIRQSRIEQDDVDCIFRETRFRIGHSSRDAQVGVSRSFVFQHAKKQAGITGIIFDQQDFHV